MSVLKVEAWLLHITAAVCFTASSVLSTMAHQPLIAILFGLTAVLQGFLAGLKFHKQK